jgi:hypothetical protein
MVLTNNTFYVILMLKHPYNWEVVVMKKKAVMIFLALVCAAFATQAFASDSEMLRILDVQAYNTTVPGEISVLVFTNQNATTRADFVETCYGELGHLFDITGGTEHETNLYIPGNGTYTLYVAARNETSLDTSYIRYPLADH